MANMKDALEEELREMISKYSDELTAGDITESIVGTVTCICCALIKSIGGTLDQAEQDLVEIVVKNVKKAHKYYGGIGGIS